LVSPVCAPGLLAGMGALSIWPRRCSSWILPYVFAQPVVRYGYLVVGILVFLAADIAWRTAESLSKRPLHGHVLAATPEAQSH
jgi:hypothetical protein